MASEVEIMSVNSPTQGVPPVSTTQAKSLPCTDVTPDVLGEAERKFLEECEAAYEANPNVLYSWEEVVAYIKRKK